MNKRFVEYSLAGWINPKTLAYIESSSTPTNSKIVGEGHIRFIDKDTINILQYGVLEDGSVAMFSENLTRVDAVPSRCRVMYASLPRRLIILLYCIVL